MNEPREGQGTLTSVPKPDKQYRVHYHIRFSTEVAKTRNASNPARIDRNTTVLITSTEDEDIPIGVYTLKEDGERGESHEVKNLGKLAGWSYLGI